MEKHNANKELAEVKKNLADMDSADGIIVLVRRNKGRTFELYYGVAGVHIELMEALSKIDEELLKGALFLQSLGKNEEVQSEEKKDEKAE